MTHDLVERMVGHRTRLAQESPEHWHDGEDEGLERYLEASEQMDKSMATLSALVPRGWLVLGLLPFAPGFLSGRGSTAGLAVGLGGVLLAFRALRRLAIGVSHLAGAWAAWKSVVELVHVAARTEGAGLPQFAVLEHPVPQPALGDDRRLHLLDAHDITFAYPDRSECALNGCNLSICTGDRVLLQGHSGGGKSTLASILVGIRAPKSGLLLLEGLDCQTVGLPTWRRRVVAAPQFHENHVLTETFAFNLLMGRRWPPSPEDMAEAEAVCRELGLGDLLNRMPAGLLQMVGDTGWQLSHGERGRLYIARALLQGGNLVVLDESFAQLDPENLRLAFRCVLTHSPTLMVIAHP
jgi:ATP-binding cassette subfamily B protein